MGQAADSLGKVGKKLRTIPGEGVDHGTSLLRKAVNERVKRDTGGDRRLSGLGPRGKPLTVKVTKRGSGNYVEGHVMASPAKQRGPWFWMEEGTRAGVRRFRSGSLRTGSYRHPGTPAKRTWSDPVDRVAPSVERHFEELFKRAMNGR